MVNKTEFSSKESLAVIKKFYYYNAISETKGHKKSLLWSRLRIF